MIWDDTGFLLSKNRYNENSIIAEIFTKNHGKVSGIIFGGTSKKIKNYLQIGNKVHINFNSKSDNKIGYFKVEIQEALSPLYFDNRQKLLCISAAMHLVKILTAEFQKNEVIYKLIENFYVSIKYPGWIKSYIYWELELFRILGYDLEFSNIVEKKIIENQLQYVSKSSTQKKIIPNFLVDKNENSENLETLIDGLKLVGNYLEKSILRPNNISFPDSRVNFLNTLK